MQPASHRRAVQAADEVVVTDHAIEKGYTKAEIRDAVQALAGSLYLDREQGTYHLVTPDDVYVIRLDGGRRIVITAFPHDSDAPRYQLDRFTLLQG